jgi:hypothetical protein
MLVKKRPRPHGIGWHYSWALSFILLCLNLEQFDSLKLIPELLKTLKIPSLEATFFTSKRNDELTRIDYSEADKLMKEYEGIGPRIFHNVSNFHAYKAQIKLICRKRERLQNMRGK